MACGGGGGGDDDSPPPNISNTPPVVSLTGDETLILHLGDTFSDPGATADDQEDGNISALVTVSGSVDSLTAGRYTLSYSVTDSNGATSPIVERNVIVVPPLTVDVDNTITPELTTITDVDGIIMTVGAASVNDIQADFVETELLVASDDIDAVTAFADRWSGSIVETIEITDSDDFHTVRIDPTGVDTSVVNDYLKDLGADGYGDILFSSDAARDLFAVSLKEMSETGMSISMNWLMTPNGISDGDIAEESNAEIPSTPSGIEYFSNPFSWPYINLDSPQDTGVGAAWQLMEFLDVREQGQILVIDGGFIDTGDLPEGTNVSGASWGTENSTSCGGSSCLWHGTAVSHVAAATPDNNIGIAGSAGSHARLELLQLNSFTLRGFGRLLGLILAAPLNGPPEVINLSGSVEVPPVLNVGVNRLLDPLIGRAHDFGLLIVAAAGNDGTNVDQRAELFGWTLPFERSTIIPCETRSVICVGGLTYDSITRHPNSNYGTDLETDSVDIYASYEYWIPKIADDGTILNTNKLGKGTSYSAPFVSGIIAMMRSANPDLSAERTAQCLFNSAHTHGDTNSSGGSQRRVDAFAAVNCAKFVNYPLIQILEPASDITVNGQTGINLRASSLGEDGKTLPVQWSSDLDGEILGQVDDFRLLSVGTHTLTANVTDADGNEASETVMVTVLNNPPTVEILSPTDGASFGERQAISLRAHSNDIDANGQLDDTQISWSITGNSFTAAGHNAQIPTGQLAVGNYELVVSANDGTDSVEQTSNFSIVECTGECPSVQITAPGDILIRTSTSDEHGVYADVDFSVLATDEEDNDISTDVIWRSVNSINGAPSTLCAPIDFGGVTVTCDTFTQRLYLGENSADIEYIITAEVFDSDGNSATDTISVKMVYDLGLIN